MVLNNFRKGNFNKTFFQKKEEAPPNSPFNKTQSKSLKNFNYTPTKLKNVAKSKSIAQ